MTRALPAIIFLFFTALVRLPVLHRSVLDWDESVYFLMAQAWLDGHLPYTTIWDNKPPGIYAIFAIFQWLIPGIAAIRVAATIFISAISWIVFELTADLSESRLAGWAAGFLFIICSLSNDGLSSNSEIFMDFFTVAAILAVLKSAPSWLPGLLLGCGFMVKYVCAPEILVILTLLYQRRQGLRSVIQAILASSIPLIAVTLTYELAGKLSLWIECGITSNFRRAEIPVSFQSISSAIAQQGERWGPLYITGAIAAFRIQRIARAPFWFLPAWLVAALAGALAAKSFYDHYFLEMLPPLCVASGVAVARLPRQWRFALPASILLAVLPVAAGVHAILQASGPDPQRVAAKELQLAKAKSLYVFDAQPILYGLTHIEPPTYYVFPSDLIGVTLPKVAGVNPVQEVGRILAENPQYIVRHSWERNKSTTNGNVYGEVDRALAAHYVLWRHIPGGVDIYKRK